MLQVNQLHQYYGGSHILRGWILPPAVARSPVCSGATGWGNHFAEVSDGADPGAQREVLWQEKNITHRKPHQRVQSGIAYVPQGGRFFRA